MQPAIPEDVEAHREEYKQVWERGNYAAGHAERALPLVREWIQKRGRILYGGMAVDYALKAAGHEGIYKEGTVPDYDFMSPTFYEDSIELADMLHAAGFPDISCINATHITSRRVRIQFFPVADMTYIPESIYEMVPTLEWEGFRVVHPQFQKLDIHRALCTPLEKPPREVIQQRLAKDIARFRMMDELYPLEDLMKKSGKAVEKKVKGKKIEDKEGKEASKTNKASKTSKKTSKKGGAAEATRTLTFPHSWLNDAILGGWAAHAALCHEVARLGDNITITYPGHWGAIPLTLISDNAQGLMEEVRAGNAAVKELYYSKYIDNLYPRIIVVPLAKMQIEIYDNLGILQPMVMLPKLNGVRICGAQYVALYHLLRSFNPPINEMFPQGAAAHLAAYKDICGEVIRAEAAEPPTPHFMLTLSTYGRANWSPDYISAMRRYTGTPQGLNGAVDRPPNYHPGRAQGGDEEFEAKIGGGPQSFTFEGNELFMIDGARRTPFGPLEP
jgi:hypothetical protein